MYPYSPYTLKRIYEQCRWHRGELDNQRICVTDPLGKEHFLHRRRIDKYEHRIRTFLKALPRAMMRSESNSGLPWQAASNIIPADIRYDAEYATILLALGQASGYVTLRPVELRGLVGEHLYVIIEDLRWRLKK